MALVGNTEFWANLSMYTRIVLDVQATSFFVVIGPPAFLWLVMHLQIHHKPLGAILFYVVFIAGVVAQALVEYLKTH